MNKQTIPIFITIDNNYVPYAEVAIRSIKDNSSREYNYNIHILHGKLIGEDKEILKSLEDENYKIIFREMKEVLENITDRIENRFKNTFIPEIYFRLFIPEIFTEYDKGIYIDSDIVVPGDISELYNKELEENLIGACVDKSVQDIPEIMNYYENAVGISRNEYVNSGVLLMNLKTLREKGFTKHFLNLLNKYHFDTVAPDQDYLNVICNGKILYIGEEWDAMPTEGGTEIKNPKLIHYNLFQKPWCYDNICYADYFWKYAKESSYYEQILKFKENYSKEQIEADKNALSQIITEGDKIARTGKVTFKKIFESGEHIRL